MIDSCPFEPNVIVPKTSFLWNRPSWATRMFSEYIEVTSSSMPA